MFYKVLEEKEKRLGKYPLYLHFTDEDTESQRLDHLFHITPVGSSRQHVETELSVFGCCCTAQGCRTKNRTVYMRGSNHEQDGSSEKEGSLLGGVNPKVLWEETLFGQLPRILTTRL